VALETFQFLDSLVPDNPVVSDGLVNGDDHIRGIKFALKQSFPNITGEVTATQTDLNTVNTGVVKLQSAGVFFSANTTDGFVNSLAGDIDVQLQGAVAATFQRTGGVNFFKVKGALQVDTSITGPGMCPIGSIVVWPSDTLPPTTEGVFTWCNGATFNKTDYPTAHDRLNGNGTTFSVPNYQEVALVGKSGMGGATSPGLLNSISSSLKAVLNAIFGSDTQSLIANQIPTITGAGSSSGSFSGSISGTANTVILGNSSGGGIGGGGSFGVTGNAGVTGSCSGSYSGSASITSNNTGGSAPVHNNVQPSKAVNWIIRIG